MKKKMKNKIKYVVGVMALAMAFLFTLNINVLAAQSVPDLSEWQGNLTAGQVKKLKSESPFVILRVQYGSTRKDLTFDHNVALLKKYKVPYGVYSFSQYLNPNDAKQEAKDLYNRAPQAKFYVNDYEEQTVTSGGTNATTKAWYTQMNKLTSRPILFYSYVGFMQTYASTAVSSYDGYWIAAYQSYRPARQHVLWQYSSNHYFTSIGQSIDASLLNDKPLSWFIGSGAAAENSISKYPNGGRKVGEKVRISKRSILYSPRTRIDDSLTKVNLKIKQVKSVRFSKSNQAALVYNGNTPIGWALAQDLTAYYSSSKVKKVKVITNGGINTYSKTGKRLNHVKKGTVLKVSGYRTNGSGAPVFIHAGHTTHFTANKNLVKMVK